MKSLVRTIVVLTTFNLAMIGSGLIAEAPPEKPRETVVETPDPREMVVETPDPREMVVETRPEPVISEPPTPVESSALPGPPAPRKTFHTISGRTGVGGVVMRGLPGNPVAGPDGSYSAMVEHGWSGKVIPAKEGYTFQPPFRVYDRVAGHLANQDYIAILITFTISGTTGLEGVVMQGLPGNPVTNSEGRYSATVAYGWSGRVTPKKEGYTFDPPYRIYSNVTADQNNQNYITTPEMLTISGVIAVGGSPIQGVRVSADNGGGSDITDRQGRYTVRVPYAWSGEVTATREGFVFAPPSKSYTNVTSNISDDRGSAVRPWSLLGRTDGRKVLVIPTTEIEVEDIAAIHEDMCVMAHIFDKKAKEPRLIRGAFVDFGEFFGRDSRDTEAIYIQDYGALFMMEVDLPISVAPKPEQEKPEGTQEHVDPTWLQARNEVFLPKAASTDPRSGLTEHGPEKVEQLKEELVKALKHAANIRGLKPDEWIILTVVGGAQQPTGAANLVLPPIDLGPRQPRPVDVEMGGYLGVESYGGRGYGMGGYGMGGYYGAMGFLPATVLTIRVKKADVDTFAKGEMPFDEFQNRVLVFTYPHLSGKATGEQRFEAVTVPRPMRTPAPSAPRR
jgi:hypothetical protein